MYVVVIKRPDGGGEEETRLVPGVYRIGKSPASHIQFDRPEVSGRHAQLVVGETELRVADMGSSNGTFVDDERVGEEPVLVSIGSTIRVGMVEIFARGPALPPPNADSQGGESAATIPGRSSKLADPQVKKTLVEEIAKVESARSHAAAPGQSAPEVVESPILKISGIPVLARPLVQEIKRRAHLELLQRLNLKRMAVSGISEEELAEKAKSTIHSILLELTIPLPPGVALEKVERELVNEAIGLGPLEDLIDMDDITEIMVNGHNQVFVEREGVLYKTDTAFADDYQVAAAIERIVSPLGRRIDESSPMVDARLKDGSRVNAVIPPLSLGGPTLTIRKFAKSPFQTDDLVRFGSISEDIVKFLRICVQVRKNIIISGGTGSGKTTLLNVLSSFLPSTERIVTIEDAAELQLRQEHVVRLESRPPNIEGKGQISIRDLVRNSLRMRPDRIVVGECRGGEALDMLQAMNTGHDGSLTTIHANTPRDALARLETLVLMAGYDLPLRAIREQVVSAITIVVQINRTKDGGRRVTSVSEIIKMEGDIITMQELFTFVHEGWTPQGKIIGRHVATGSIPTFMEEIERSKLDLDIGIFRDGRRGGGIL